MNTATTFPAIDASLIEGVRQEDHSKIDWALLGSRSSTFAKKYNAIERELPFNPHWPNTTGYYDNAAGGSEHSVKLPAGAEAKSFDPSTGRYLIFIGTCVGTMVFFNRYTDFGRDAIAINGGYLIMKLLDIQTSSMNADQLLSLIGDPNNTPFSNVAVRIDQYIEDAVGYNDLPEYRRD